MNFFGSNMPQPQINNPFPDYETGASLNLTGAGSKTAIDDMPTDVSAGSSDELAITGNYLGLTVPPRKILLIFMILLASLAAIVLRSAQLQLASGAKYRERAEGNRIRTEWSAAERGIIYDRNGSPLVKNVPDLSVTITPADLPADQEARRDLVLQLAEILGIGPVEIEERLAERGASSLGQVVIAEHLTHEQAVKIEIEAGSQPALQLKIGTRRDYLAATGASSLAHVLGYQGRPTTAELSSQTGAFTPDLVGKSGLERSYDAVMSGQPSRRTIEVDALRRSREVVAEDAGAPGSNLVLSLDLEVQREAENILVSEMKAWHKTRGSLIALDPRTGELLALVSLPAFDNNKFASGISTEDYRALAGDTDNPMFSRAIAASLPSGSVFKLVIAAAALEEKLITANTTVLSTGGIRIDKWYFPDWKAGGHGPTNVAKALAESVNTFFYAIGGGYDRIEGLGVNRINAYARRFGLGDRLGLDLAGEGDGFLPTKEWKETVKGEQWYIGDTYHLAIGQGDILVTPLQITAMTSVFANGGKLFQPRLVNAVTSSDGTRQVVEPKLLNAQVVSPQTINIVRRGLRQAVTTGSARSLAALPVAVAAKTGTAQWSQTKNTHAWFTSFAPYENPEIVVTVIVEEGGEGSQIGAAVARRFYEWYFSRK
ncbi:MAG: penicillin-binding protein 2 [Patescibacteria group bacterium]|jgi:penicillin-binding protein 2